MDLEWIPLKAIFDEASTAISYDTGKTESLGIEFKHERI